MQRGQLPSDNGAVPHSSDAADRHLKSSVPACHAASLEQMRDLDRLETAGRYAASVAHELNNLLTAIVAQAELAAEELATDDPACERLELVVGQAERASDLARELLTLSRRPSGRTELVDLGGLVLDSAAMLRRLVGPRIGVAVSARRGSEFVEADRSEVGQVLVNLVANARDAMPHGGHVVLETGTTAGCVTLTVRDTGCGMDDATASRVFEPFFTTKPAGRGTGLGLAIVRETVERFGGAVEVRSVHGRGTTFEVSLPASAATRGAPEDRVGRALHRDPFGRDGLVVLAGGPALAAGIEVAAS
jgi:two-component system, cell cycle sensor histidine kinase and response regulator CckA